MKIKNIILFVFVLVFSLSLTATNAEYKIYSTQEEFENYKGNICEAATDGCNNFIVTDGKVTAGTKKFCFDYTPAWTCTKYKEDVINTKSLPKVDICTMEYAPVCGIDGKIYGNSCMANGAEIAIAYEGECKKNQLSKNDENLYQFLVKKLDLKIQEQITKIVGKYLNLMENYTDEKKEKINILMVDKLDTKIHKILSKYPQDIALPESVNNKYLSYKLLQLELKKLIFVEKK